MSLTGSQITFEKFLSDWDGAPAEWVKGEVVPLSPVRKQHSELGAFLLKILGAYVEFRELGALYYEPFLMKASPELPARSPDLFFVSRPHLDRVQEKHLEGPADLVIEIVSPDSRGTDRGDKFYEYEQGQVGEYWLLDPLRRQAEFYVLEHGVFQAVAAEAGVYRSRALTDLWLRVEWLWSLPGLFPVLKEWRFL